MACGRFSLRIMMSLRLVFQQINLGFNGNVPVISWSSFEIDPAEWLEKISEEGGNSNNIKSSLLVDIKVVEGSVESVVVGGGQPGGSLSTALLEMSADGFLSNLQGVLSVDVELTVWLWVLLVIVALGGVVGDQVLGELVHWWDSLHSGITNESLWSNSSVSVLVVSEFIDGSWESVLIWVPSVPVWKGGLENLRLLKLDKGGFLKGSRGLVKDLLVVQVIGLS